MVAGEGLSVIEQRELSLQVAAHYLHGLVVLFKERSLAGRQRRDGLLAGEEIHRLAGRLQRKCDARLADLQETATAEAKKRGGEATIVESLAIDEAHRGGTQALRRLIARKGR